MNTQSIVRVREVMEPDFAVIDGMSTIAHALELMQQRTARCLVVHKRHDDDEHGLLLLSDIARKVLAKDRSPERVNVYEVMAKPVICVDADMDIRFCAQLFNRFDITRAPVLDNGEVVGTVSFTELVLRGLALKPASGTDDT